ncbi:MAG: ATP-dependent DNA helicase RecG, partial [Candidatus Spechtbacterales bacterium]
LAKLGIKEVRDLLFHFPARYENFGNVVPIGSARPGDVVTVQGRVTDVDARVARSRRLNVLSATITDDSGSLPVTWFNQAYLKDTLTTDKPVLLAGKVTLGKQGPYLANPIHEIKRLGADPIHTARLVPVYPETRGVTSRWFRYIIEKLLPLADNVEDPLPQELRDQFDLMPVADALRAVHFPATTDEADRARHRFSFEELFCIQLAVLKTKRDMQREAAPAIATDIEAIKAFTESLTFTLTDSQKKAAWRILKDMERATPMNRLLEGDVGSGKTVVAAVAALNAVRAGYRVAVMAPTEILAHQHYNNFAKVLYGTGVDVSVLTRTKKDRAATQADVVIGTHALIQDKVNFKKLGLVVIDEQHRFGVAQRAALKQKMAGHLPHLLSMTATPIPRTLALTVYGDLDISLLREMPKGRKKIETRLVLPNEREEAFTLIRNELDAGRQAFVIFPLVEESEKLEAKAATQERERLAQGPFKNYKVGLLHGKLKPAEKESVMQEFKDGKLDVLVATSVVEVGIDVPNATVMMIENAERFGLAQLHQFRGRVGRSEHQSYCLLLSESTTQTARKRLRALVKADSGFKLAEYDLALRGPGEVYGTRQSGLPDLAVAALSDVKLIEDARLAAQEYLETDPTLAHNKNLHERVETLQKTMHFE